MKTIKCPECAEVIPLPGFDGDTSVLNVTHGGPKIHSVLEDRSEMPTWENPDYFPSWPCAGVNVSREEHQRCDCRWVGFNWASDEDHPVEPHCSHHKRWTA